MCAYAHDKREPRSPLRPGSRVFWCSLFLYLSLIFKHFHTKWERKRKKQSIIFFFFFFFFLGGGGAVATPSKSATITASSLRNSHVPLRLSYVTLSLTGRGFYVKVLWPRHYRQEVIVLSCLDHGPCRRWASGPKQKDLLRVAVNEMKKASPSRPRLALKRRQMDRKMSTS